MDKLDWDLVDQAAKALGVGKQARRKWRQRNSVPHKWRLPLIEETDGKITSETFKQEEAAR
jgi:hypothetical protein